MRQLAIAPSITNRDSISLSKYLQDIGKLQRVSIDEEALLAQRIRQGDEVALHQLATANLRFVVSVAKQYHAHGLSLSDMINEGNIGLMKAASRFDETRGFKFISYAVWWIRQSIIQAIAQNGHIVHMPANKKALFVRIQKAQALLEQDLEREPSVEELAALLDVQADEVRITMASNSFHDSLDAPLAQDENITLLDTLQHSTAAADRQMQQQSLHTELRRCFTILSKTEREVLCLSYGIETPECSQEEISKKFGLSGERIRQIRQKALQKLRRSSKTEILKTYLGQ